jgi:hypothetical protein
MQRLARDYKPGLRSRVSVQHALGGTDTCSGNDSDLYCNGQRHKAKRRLRALLPFQHPRTRPSASASSLGANCLPPPLPPVQLCAWDTVS